MADYNNLTDFLGDRNIQNLLAGIGAGLDPKGVAGALGNATIAYNRGVAAQDREKRTDVATNQQTQLLIDALKQHGGFTPVESPGITSATATPTGGVKLEITPPAKTNNDIVQTTTTPSTPIETTPTAPVLAPVAPPVTPYLDATKKKASISDVLPFYSARLG